MTLEDKLKARVPKTNKEMDIIYEAHIAAAVAWYSISRINPNLKDEQKVLIISDYMSKMWGYDIRKLG